MRRFALALVLVVGALMGGAATAGAHTGFESSDPADGQVVEGPVDEITLVFSAEANPAGERFQVREESGSVREPSHASTSDGRSWTLRFDPALEAGTVGVRWSVAAPDAHPINGSFSFRSETGPTPDPALATGQDATGQDDVGAPDALDAFLTSETTSAWAGPLGSLGRMLGMVGTLFGVGGLAFAVTALRGTRGEVRHIVFWIRRCGLLIGLGAGLELCAALGSNAAADGSAPWSAGVIAAVLWSSTGAAVALRILGAIGLIGGPRIVVARADAGSERFAALGQLIGAGQVSSEHAPAMPVAGGYSDEVALSGEASSRDSWTLAGAGSPGAFLAAAALIVSYSFDGHTVSKGNRLIMGLADAAHVGAAAVWLGGVTTLALLLWSRRRHGRDIQALALVVRFSVVAALALAVAGAAGVAMTIMILDRPSQLWSSTWGQLLIAKTLLVAVAAAGGAYNHWVLVPELARRFSEPVSRRLQMVVTVESVVLVGVAILTALLVASGT